MIVEWLIGSIESDNLSCKQVTNDWLIMNWAASKLAWQKSFLFHNHQSNIIIIMNGKLSQQKTWEKNGFNLQLFMEDKIN